jgi:hypothetical protein
MTLLFNNNKPLCLRAFRRKPSLSGVVKSFSYFLLRKAKPPRPRSKSVAGSGIV